MSGVLKNADQSELLRLKTEYRNLLESINDEDNSQAGLIRKLGENLEQRINLGDPECNFPPSQISTHLKIIFEGKPIASFLHRYLPDKFKDSRDSENAKLAEHLSSGRLMVCQDISLLTNEQLERYYESRGEYKNLLDDNYRTNKKEIERCEEVALERGLQLGGYKFRRPISADNIIYEVPQTLEGLNDVIEKGFYEIGDAYHDIGKSYHKWKAGTYEDAKRYYLGIQTYIQVLRPHHDLKWTGDWGNWFDKGYLEAKQGKHGPGNSDKFPTMLCTWCSRDVEDDPEDFEVMYVDETSRTGWRCRGCQGESYKTRETTREQVGDRRDYIFNFAKDLLQYYPFWRDVLHDYNQKYLMRVENSRKDIIGYQFSNSAIAGTDTKVVRNRVTKSE